ncbi:MAG TPA: NUDIX hydrolase [Aggregatilineaceae bacterium]|jgi:ADP-ribose pyrophosphatase|nr:NUDIX hydrolase [Aggregatilineaceae bacterium]
MTPLDEKILSSEPVYLGRLVKLYVETVELPDGNRSIREIVRHPGAVAMVPLLAGGEVVLVRQFRGAADRVLLEIPAGTLEAGEDPLAAAGRELQEEAGYRPGKLDRLGGEFTAPGYTSEFIHLFLATELEPSRLARDADEFLEVVTLPLDEALRQIETGEIQDGKTIIGLLLAARKMRR